MIRKILSIALMTTALTASAAHAKDTIVWWDFLSGGDGVRMKSMIDEFNKENAGKVEIEATTLVWGVPFYTKVQTSAAIGQGPDVMTYHESRMPLGISTGSLSPLSPDELKASGIQASDFGPANWKAAQGPDGKQYAVPLDIHSIILYYNKTLLKKAGLLGDDGKPKGLDGVANWDAALAKLTTDGGVRSVGADRGRRHDVAHLLYPAQPAGRRFPEGWQVPRRRQSRQGDDRDRGNAEVGQGRLDAVQDRISRLDRAVHLGQGGDAHQRRLGGAHHGGPRQEGPVVRLGRDPDPDALRASRDLGRFACLRDPGPKGNPVDPAKRKLVLDTIHWFNVHSLEWAGGGHIPAYLPVQDSAAFKALKPNSDYSSLAKTAVFDPVSVLAGVASPVYDAAGNFVMPAMNGEMTPADAAKQLRDDLQGQTK